MEWDRVRCAFGAPSRRLRAVGVVAMAVAAAGLGGCSSPAADHFATAAGDTPSSNSTVAFESIDGPPPEVFRTLVATLNDEAATRKVAVVSRSAAATYRVRGYISAVVERDKTTFDWVWDLYDADRHRALRISGEEPSAAASRRHGAWADASETVLRRIARDGIAKIAAFLDSLDATPAPASQPDGPALLARRDDSPEAAGIVRLVRGRDVDQSTGSTAASAADAASPQPRGANPHKTAAAAAPTTNGRAAGQ